MAKDKDKGLAHTISHTDTARGKGGGRLTQDPQDLGAGKGPSGRVANPDENAKDADFVSPSGDIGGGADPEDVAGRMKSTGKDSGLK
jgi:hypothetical protein